MWLTDRQIADAVDTGKLLITPFDSRRTRPASHLLTAGTHVMRPSRTTEPIDVYDTDAVRSAWTCRSPIDRSLTLGPGEMVLLATAEQIGISPAHLGRLTGLSHLARLGLTIHVTADHISPGFGWGEPTAVTLEVINHHPRPVRLYPGMPICHLLIAQLAEAVARSYHQMEIRYSGLEQPSGSNYPCEFGPTGSATEVPE